MTDALKQAAQQALEAMELYPVTVNHWKAVLLPAAEALRAALSAPQPAAPQADPWAPSEIQEAIERGEFEPGHWTVSAQHAIEKNPSGALTIIARLRNEVARLKAAPAPAQAVPLTQARVMLALAMCPTDMSHPQKCEWIAQRLNGITAAQKDQK